MTKKFIPLAKKVIDLEIQALQKLKRKIDNSFNKAVVEIAKCKSKVILCGVGKSGLIAAKISATLSSVGTPSFNLSASDSSHGDLGSVSKKDILILISYSGKTNELKNIIQYANRNKITLIGNKIPFVKENLNMKSAIKILSNKKLGVLIVQNKQNRTIGVITDGQIRRYNEKRQNLNEMKVAKIMTKNPISIDKQSLAAKALALMNEKKITSLCVHDKKNKHKTIGVLHIHNILQSNIG